MRYFHEGEYHSVSAIWKCLLHNAALVQTLHCPPLFKHILRPQRVKRKDRKGDCDSTDESLLGDQSIISDSSAFTFIYLSIRRAVHSVNLKHQSSSWTGTASRWSLDCYIPCIGRKSRSHSQITPEQSQAMKISIDFITHLLLCRVGVGGAEVYPSMHWVKWRETAWTDRQSITGLTQIDRQSVTLTFTPKGNLESPVHLTCMSLDWRGKLEETELNWTQWEEANAPRKGLEIKKWVILAARWLCEPLSCKAA